MGSKTQQDKPETRRKRIGYFSSYDMYCEKDSIRWSPILFILVGSIWILRRISLFENLKRIIYGADPMPARFLDIYLLILWTGTAVSIVFFDSYMPPMIKWLYFLIIVQIVQTSIYHEIWRPISRKMRNDTTEITYSRFRNLVIGVGNFIFVTCLYGLVYWKSSCTGFESSHPFTVPADAIYFSFTVAWSAGSVNIDPQKIDMFVKGTIISQIIVSLLLISLIISISISAMKATEELPRSKTS